MKYIIGYTAFEYAVCGVRIPKKMSSRADQPGEKGVTEVTEEKLKELRQNRVFKHLEENKDIKVLDTKPSWAITHVEKIQQKDTENEKLRKEVEELRKQLAAKNPPPPPAQ